MYTSEKLACNKYIYIDVFQCLRICETAEKSLQANDRQQTLGFCLPSHITCKCHGKSLLEIKCPFKFKQGLSQWKS